MQVDSATRDLGPAQSAGVASGTAQQQTTESDKQDKQNDQHTTSVDSLVPTTDQSTKGENDNRSITQDDTASSTPPSTSVLAPSSPYIPKASQPSNEPKSLASKSVVVSSNRQKNLTLNPVQTCLVQPQFQQQDHRKRS